MNASQKGIDLIKSFEGFRAETYKDSGGIPTIGYGHALKPNESFTRISEQDAENLLKQDVYVAERYINNNFGRKIINQNEFDALVSFIFNIGQGAFNKSSVNTYIRLDEFKIAMTWWAKWVRDGRGEIMPGLVIRREKEIRLFNEKGQYITEFQIDELFQHNRRAA